MITYVIITRKRDIIHARSTISNDVIHWCQFRFFVILLFLLQKYSYKDNLIGYELGMVIVFSISALAGQIIQSFIPEWSIGLLGLIPIYMGIKGEDDDDKNDEKHQSNKGVIAVLLGSVWKLFQPNQN